jgi:hypothetical protein
MKAPAGSRPMFCLHVRHPSPTRVVPPVHNLELHSQIERISATLYAPIPIYQKFVAIMSHPRSGTSTTTKGYETSPPVPPGGRRFEGAPFPSRRIWSRPANRAGPFSRVSVGRSKALSADRGIPSGLDHERRKRGKVRSQLPSPSPGRLSGRKASETYPDRGLAP